MRLIMEYRVSVFIGFVFLHLASADYLFSDLCEYLQLIIIILYSTVIISLYPLIIDVSRGRQLTTIEPV